MLKFIKSSIGKRRSEEHGRQPGGRKLFRWAERVLMASGLALVFFCAAARVESRFASRRVRPPEGRLRQPRGVRRRFARSDHGGIRFPQPGELRAWLGRDATRAQTRGRGRNSRILSTHEPRIPGFIRFLFDACASTNWRNGLGFARSLFVPARIYP